MILDRGLLYHSLKIMTHLGDPAFLLPLTVALVAILLRRNYRAAALRFGLIVAADMTLTLLSKLWFYADGGSRDLDILSPSGHMSLSVAFYGCTVIILSSRRHLALRATIIATAATVMFAVGISRIDLGMHTFGEVLFGSLIGGLCVAAFAAGTKQLPRFQLALPRRLTLAGAACCICVWAIAHRVDTEERIGKWGNTIGTVFGVS